MFTKKRYKYNPDTLAYELHRTPTRVLFSRGFLFFLCTVAMSGGYFWLYSDYLKLDTPKMLQLKRENVELLANLDLMSHQLEKADHRLERLKQRDNQIYRPIFGMDDISEEVRNAGSGGVEQYSYLEYTKNGESLARIARRFDQLSRKTYVQSLSFDDVSMEAEQADKMATSVPHILPVNNGDPKFRISSRFGMRNDPVFGDVRRHEGIDISGPSGSEIYAAGDGVVIKSTFEYGGYGNYIMIDHGFGYRTRYAHLKSGVVVREGQKVTRGEVIGYMGSTGKSIGTHLHYEVILRGIPVNPYNYFDSDIGSDEYDNLISTVRGL